MAVPRSYYDCPAGPNRICTEIMEEFGSVPSDPVRLGVGAN